MFPSKMFFTLPQPSPSRWRIEDSGGVRRLYRGLVEWMADDAARRAYMRYYAQMAFGRVLVGGLGLCIVQEELAAHRRVQSVTTVENDKELADFLGAKCVIDDFWRFAHRHGGFDSIIVDLWPDNASPEEDLTEKVTRVRARNPKAVLMVHGYPHLSNR